MDGTDVDVVTEEVEDLVIFLQLTGQNIKFSFMSLKC